MKTPGKEWLSQCEDQQQMIDLVLKLKEQGMSQDELHSEFLSYALWLREHNEEVREDCVLEVLDRIWGWCGPDMKLF